MHYRSSILCFSLLFACSDGGDSGSPSGSPSAPPSDDVLCLIVPGESTMENVEDVLGEPEVKAESRDFTTLTYLYGQGPTPQNYHSLMFAFDAEGKMDPSYLSLINVSSPDCWDVAVDDEFAGSSPFESVP